MSRLYFTADTYIKFAENALNNNNIKSYTLLMTLAYEAEANGGYAQYRR